MTNLEKLNNIFAEVFSVDVSELNESFDKNSVDSWDSVHQLSLTSAVEDEFDIMLDAEDILGFTSYNAGLAILRKNEVDI
jgi:acyl carrier protein